MFSYLKSYTTPKTRLRILYYSLLVFYSGDYLKQTTVLSHVVADGHKFTRTISSINQLACVFDVFYFLFCLHPEFRHSSHIMKLHRKITALIFCVGLLEPVSLAHGEDQLQEYKRSEEAVVSAPLHLDTSDGGYYVSIKVGTPPQALQLRLASNITLTWLLERYSVGGCPQTGCQHGSCKIRYYALCYER